jgi:adenosylcobinamide-GDP ribazoletransferase
VTADGDGLRLALTTFTIAPVRRPARLDRRSARGAMLWAPLVGIAVAVVAAGVLFVGRNVFEGPTVWVHAVHTELFLPPLLASILAVATAALLTRGLHLDGLADTVDGLASHRPAAEALAIMRDGATGALAAVTLVFVLLIDVTALSVSVLGNHGTQALVMAMLTGRVAMVWACTPSVPPAREDGMGALVAGTVGRGAAAAWTVVTVAAGAVWGRFDTEVGSWHGSARAVGAVVAALLVAWAFRAHAVRRLGGITGDVLGALCEIAVLVSLLVSASGRP